MVRAKKTILIADDEQVIRLLVSQSLGGEFTVLEAKDGQEAVDVARRRRPDLILMDTMMPQKDGLTALQELKDNKDTKAIPVVMLTGIGHELNIQFAKSIGAAGYITKPVGPKELMESVKRYL